jgi:hypothetical protein
MKTLHQTLILLLLVTAGYAIADEDELVLKNEAEFSTIIEMEHAFATNACKAELEIEYYQKGSSAHVESTLTNDDCGASSGSYVIQVRYRGADRQTRSKEFAELWERADTDPVFVEKDYFIADDIDIVRVRSRKLNCTCATAESADSD